MERVVEEGYSSASVRGEACDDAGGKVCEWVAVSLELGVGEREV